jgi:hypothetical protein
LKISAATAVSDIATALLAGCGIGGGGGDPPPPACAKLTDIEHVVILIQENSANRAGTRRLEARRAPVSALPYGNSLSWGDPWTPTKVPLNSDLFRLNQTPCQNLEMSVLRAIEFNFPIRRPNYRFVYNGTRIAPVRALLTTHWTCLVGSSVNVDRVGHWTDYTADAGPTNEFGDPPWLPFECQRRSNIPHCHF